jgi:hypothetical protein
MDADDRSYDDRLESQVNVLDQCDDVAVVCSAYDVIDEKGQFVRTETPPESSKLLVERLIFTNPICHPTVMMRKYQLESVGGYDEQFQFAQDYDLWLRFSDIAKIYAIQKPLLAFRIYPNSSATGKQRLHQRYFANRARESAYQRKNNLDLSKNARALHYYSRGLYEITEENMKSGKQLFILAFDDIPDLTGTFDEMLAMTVNLAVELGPSGRRLIASAKDVEVAGVFLNKVTQSIPITYRNVARREIFAEFHAACAYLFAKQKKTCRTFHHIVLSWLSGPRHRRNYGLIKKLVSSFK